MGKKRFFSLILSILMVLQVFVTPVSAQSQGYSKQKAANQSTEGTFINDKTQIFKFENKNRKTTPRLFGMFRTMSNPGSSGVKTEKASISMETTGLDMGSDEFGWDAFGSSESFKAWIYVQYEGEEDWTKASDEITINKQNHAKISDIEVRVNLGRNVKYYAIFTQYDTDDTERFKIRAEFNQASQISAGFPLNFELSAFEMVSTKIQYSYIDEYNKVTTENKPVANLEGLYDFGEDKDLDAKTEGESILIRDIQGKTAFDYSDKNVNIDLKKAEFEENSIKYLVKSEYDYKTGGKITIQRQKDVVVPRLNDDQSGPIAKPNNYNRLIFDAYESDENGIKGEHTTGKYEHKRYSYIDVKEGTKYDNKALQNEIAKLNVKGYKADKEYVQLSADPWNPKVPRDTAVVADKTTYKARYKKSTEDIIPFIPADNTKPTDPKDKNIPAKDKDENPIDMSEYDIVAFKTEDANRGVLELNIKKPNNIKAEVQKVEYYSALVKKAAFRDSKKALTFGEFKTAAKLKEVPKTEYKFWFWDEKADPKNKVLDEKVLANEQVYTAHFIKDGQDITNEYLNKTPLPDDTFKVEVKKDNTIKADDADASKSLYGKSYAVFKDSTLAKTNFPTPQAEEKYSNPVWKVGETEVAEPWAKAITEATTFTATAGTSTAEEILKAGGLKAVDIKVFVGTPIVDGFWNKGVALSDPTKDTNGKLAAALNKATVTDATVNTQNQPAPRITDAVGTFPGTLKVTFPDKSFIEVKNQNLIVKGTEVKINFDKDANDDANAPRAKEEVVKGKISAADKGTVVDGATIVIKDKEDKIVGRGLANDDGGFVVGTKRPLIAGEKLTITVTLPGVDKESTPVTKQVKLNPDELNKVLPVGDKLYDNLKNKPGVSKAKLTKLKEAVDAGYALVPKAADQMAQKPKTGQDGVPVTDDGQKSLDNAAKAINDAIKALTDNSAPKIEGTAFKEIFKGEDLNLEDGIKVTDVDSTKEESDIAKQDGKDFSYKVYTTNSENQKVEVTGAALTNLNKTPGTYEVVYMAKDKSGAEGTLTMTLVVKDIVYTKIEVTNDPTTTKYLVKDKDTKATPVYTGTVVTLTKNNGTTETATYDKATGKFKIGEKAIDELTIAPKEVAVNESPAVVTATYKAGKTELKAKAGKNIIVQIDSDGNGKADSEENFDITKAKTMEITNQPILNYELDHKTGKATLDLKPLVVKVTDSLGNFKYFGYEEIKGDTKFALALGTDAFDKAAAKELTTADTDKKVKVTLTYKENKTLDTETSAIKVEDKRPSVIENPTPGEKREGYVSVTFNAGANGGLKGVNTFLVKKDTASSEVKVPTIVPAAGYKVKKDNGGWDKAIPATFAADFTATAQYEEDDATSETPKAGYTPITFDALDKGKIEGARTKTIYVNPAINVKLSDKAPTVTANTGYSFKAWEPAIDTAKKYTKEERILATYTSDALISDKEKAGYIKVTFAKGDHGKFEQVGNPKQDQKTEYWVKPDTLVDLREKAPKLTADAGYIHTGWSPDLVVNFKSDAGDQTITAQYGLDSDYSTTEKAGYTKITFANGDHGEFAKGAKTELWVNPAKELTLPAPGIVPHPGYSHTGWTKDNAPVNLNTATKYTKATTITAAYESDISEKEKTGFVKVTFDANKNGTFANDAKKDFWVNPNKEVNLTDKAPTVTPNSGYLFINWDHKLVAKFEQATTIKATYASAGDIKTEQTDGFAHIKFEAGDHGSFAKGATVEYWVNPEKAVVLPEPRVIVSEGYEHTGWNPAITPEQKYSKDKTTTITATYNKIVSTEKIDGHQEIKFLAGDHGTFADGKTEISIWVKPSTLVDLRKSAPKVTVTTEGKTFTGWDKDLVGTFAKSEQATEIKAQYAGSTSETPVPGWTEITFKSGDHGNFGTLNNTPIVEKKLWVDPKADVKLSDKAPKTIDDKNWSFDKWMDGEAAATGLDVASKYKEAKTYTASYKSDISTTPQEGFVKVTFAAGTEGSFEQGATTETYVRKDKEVDIADKAPKATPNEGLSFKGWAIDNVTADLTKIKVSKDTTITAQYTKAISDKPVDGWTRLQFNSGENGRFVKDAVTVKWVDPKVKLTLGAIAPGITPDKNYRLSAWNDGNANVDLDAEKLFTSETTFTAKYEKISSESEIPGFTKITFNSGEHGNFGTKENNKVIEKNIWVNPKSDVKLSEIAPELVIDTNWSFDKWMDGQTAADMDKAEKRTEAKTLTATYESDFSDTAKDGFAKVEFKPGEHGKFEKINDVDQKTTIYVRKDKEVDITGKAPKVTPENGYYFTGWDKPLQKVYTEDTVHTGKNTNAIADQAVDGWTQITFNAGDKGLFKANAKTVIWVKPNTKVALDDQVPGLEIEKGYSCIGWKKNAETNVTDLKVPATYDKSTTFTALYESDFSKGEKEGFVEVKFKAGANGNFGKNGETPIVENSVWVRPDKEVDLTDQAPEVTPHVGWKANGWDKEITKVTVKADTAEAARTFTAQYVKDSDTSKTEKPGYKKITFNAGAHGTFANDAETVVYVNPDSEIELSAIAPTVIPAINYSFKAWNNGTADVALTAKTKYAADTTYTAQYDSDISDTQKEGFVEVKFDAGTDGEFKQVKGVDQKTTFYVKKDKLVDLTGVAPTVTGKDKKTFTGWDKPLKATFTDATTINAKYTESISDKPVEGWTEITFKAGEHGKFGTDGTTPVVVKKIWVDPKAQVALNEKAPMVTAYTNWLFDKWMDGSTDATLSTPATYTAKKTFTATYKSVFSDKQDANNVLITFKPGDNGRFKDGSKTIVYVAKNVEVDLTEKAPVVIPNQNYGNNGWDPALKGTFTKPTTITAQYVKGTFKADEIASIDVFGPTKLSYPEDGELNLDGLKIVVKDKAGIQVTYEGAQAITAAGFTITPANGTKLKIDTHNGQPIKVSKEITVGQEKKTIEGETVSTLSVSKNKSAEPTDVLARNLGENPEKTTVTGKAPEGSVIKVTDINGKDLTDGTEVKVGANKEFTITLKDKLAPGTPVKVTSTEPGKTESSPVVKQVFEDVNSDGTDDEKQKSDMPTDVKAMNQNKVVDGKVTNDPKDTTTVTGKAKAGAEIKIYNANGDDITPAGGVTVKSDGTFTAEVTRQADNAVIKVTAKEAEKALPSDPALASVIKDADNDGDADGDRATLRPSALARNIGTGTTTPKTPATFTTVEGDTEKGASVTVSYTFNGQAKSKVVTADTQGTNGLYTYKAELEDKLPAGTIVTVKAIVVGKKESTPTEAVVFDDLDGDKKPDGQGEIDFSKIVDFKLVSDPKKMDYALKSTEDKDKANLNPTGLKVFLKDASGNTGIYEYNKPQDSKFEELKGNTNFKLELVDAKGENPVAITDQTKLGKNNDANKIKVTVMNGQTKTDKSDTTGPLNVFIDANGNGIDDDKEKIDLTKVTSIKVINQPELNYPITIKDNGKKNIDLTKMVVEVSDGTVKAKFTAQELLDAKVGVDKAFKLELVQGSATAAPTTKDITSVNGIELTTANDGNKVQISKASDANVKTETKALQVFEDLDGDGKRDSKQTPAPTELKALNVKEDKFTTITGKATKGDTLKVYGEDKNEITVDPSNIKIDENGNFTIKVAKDNKALDPNTTVFVTAKAENKEESARIPVIVQVDKDGNGTADKDETTTIKSVIARNIGTGTTTPKTPATFTTIEGVAEPGSTVTITFTEKGKSEATTKTVTAGDDGSYKLELKGATEAENILLPADTEVKASAKFGDKKDSPTIETKVFEDLNADGKDDGAVNQKTGTPTVKALNVGSEPKVTTITGKAEPNAKIVAKATIENNEVVVGTATADAQTGEYKIEATKTGQANGGALDAKTLVTVTAQTTGKLVSDPASDTVKIDADGNGVADDEEDGPSEPNFDTVKVGDTSVKVTKPADKSITTIIVKDQTGKTVKAVKTTKVEGQETKIVWKVGDTEVTEENGKLVIPTGGTLTFGANQTVTVTVKDNKNKDASTTKAVQPADLKNMPAPKVDPISTETTKVTGNSEPGATVLVQLPGQTKEDAKEASVKSDGSFEFALEKPLEDKQQVTVIAKSPGKFIGEGSATVTVGLNTKQLEDTKTEADGLINDSKTNNNFDPDNNKYDKNLEEKTKTAQEVLDKAKDTDQTNDPNQTQVNTAEKDLRDAINQKNADDKVKVVETAVKGDQKPSDEDINKAQEAIDKVTDPTAKKELQDRLDKAKLIDELKDKVDKAPKDDKDHPEYKTKPEKIKTDLENALKEAEKTINDYKHGTTTDGVKTPEEAKKALDEALAEYNKEQVILSVEQPSGGSNQLVVTTLQVDVQLKVYVNGKIQMEKANLKTNALGKAIINMDKDFVLGDNVKVVGSKEGLIDSEVTVNPK